VDEDDDAGVAGEEFVLVVVVLVCSESSRRDCVQSVLYVDASGMLFYGLLNWSLCPEDVTMLKMHAQPRRIELSPAGGEICANTKVTRSQPFLTSIEGTTPQYMSQGSALSRPFVP
jgi:hypothetical protein